VRTNADFLQHLRSEIADSQKRREAFVKAKLAFVATLLGIGTISIQGKFGATPLLYLVPLISFVLDLLFLP